VPLERAAALKLALADPANRVTAAGTSTIAGAEDKATAVVSAAALVSETVQVDVPPGFSTAGVQLREDSAAGALNPSEKVAEPPFSVAVSIALASRDTLAALTVKLALVLRAFTVTEAGTVAEALLLDKLTLAAALGAAVRVTVQVLLSGVATVAGLQLKLAG